MNRRAFYRVFQSHGMFHLSYSCDESFESRGHFVLFRVRNSRKVEDSLALSEHTASGNGCRFANSATNQPYNTRLVLYHLKAMPNGAPPDNRIDRSVSIDYGKPRHLPTVNLNSNGRATVRGHLLEPHLQRYPGMRHGCMIDSSA